MTQVSGIMFGMSRAAEPSQTSSQNAALIPVELLPTEPRTENWLREGAEARGLPTTHAQFARLRDAGLLPPPDADGRYPEWALHSLVRARQAAASTRSVPRRVVALRADAILFPVPPEQLRRAMVEVVPTMRSPMRTLRTVAAATGQARGATRSRPPAAEWEAILNGPDPGLFAARAPGWYAMATMVLPARSWPEPGPLWGIALEEQVLCLAVLDLFGSGGGSPPMIKRR
jgi:hypothetical protein